MIPSPFERIHNINPLFNRLFHVPLYVLSFFILIFYFIMPYSVRIAAAAFINVIFNRPTVYLHYFGRMIGKPMNRLMMTVFYLVFFGVYSILTRVLCLFASHKKNSRLLPASPGSNQHSLHYQS